jgi:hypothetical protein
MGRIWGHGVDRKISPCLDVVDNVWGIINIAIRGWRASQVGRGCGGSRWRPINRERLAGRGSCGRGRFSCIGDVEVFRIVVYDVSSFSRQLCTNHLSAKSEINAI